MPNSVCLDASFVVRMLVGPEPLAQKAEALWQQWLQEDVLLVAPALLPFEVTNALYRYVHAGHLPLALVQNLLAAALALDLRLFMDPELHQAALQTAHRLKLPATYDAHYVALAQRLGAELWTADQRLARALRQQDFPVRVLTP